MNSIPQRRRGRPIPDDAVYMLRCVDGHLGINLSDIVPADTALEHELVKRAVRAWRRSTGPTGLGLIAIPAAWGWQQLHRPEVAAVAGAGAAGAVTALALTTPPTRPPGEAPPPSSTVMLPPVGGYPPRVGPPKRPPRSQPPATPPAGGPHVAPTGEHPTGPPTADLPVKVPTRPPITVTVTERSPSPLRTCRVVLPRLSTRGMLCGHL